MAELCDRTQQALDGYEQAAPELIPIYERLPPQTVLEPVAEYLPDTGAAVLDVGAGPGGTASWLAACGCHVTAIEPVARFREYGRNKYRHHDISWCDDRLPDLASCRPWRNTYDAILAIGVMHHLQPQDQERAIQVLSSALKPCGRLIFSLRHGPCPETRPGFPISVDKTVRSARNSGLQILHMSHKTSIQEGNRRAGVTWTWLVLGASG
ncbi:class I SAM-dependent methyltransferase [Rhodobacteraceae bacterium B1Z28]|uniref:Class I SAM-dependent methyltransferase n=1 Tax=Ruegeria haliotis TaxID=2747601 RepID=A0ABX2PMA8_9RHOB|nr:class I SAM-dependent methyltransferase [Ruegeria haliotis]NVO54905.1 class I SAM-dependent methyltransferase [Ruegeria haliotis]